MISFHSLPSSRYLVVDRISGADDSSVFKMFCDTIAEARQCLVRRYAAYQQHTEAVTRLLTVNGHKPCNLPAAAIRTATSRVGRYTVAKATYTTGVAYLEVIAL